MNVFAEILDLVRARTGLVFPPSRIANAEAGINAAMAALEIDNLDDYLARIRADEVAFDELIAELTVGETYFGRDTEQFAAIRAQILPDILARHGSGHAVRTWSAGCASGEEAYSLAIVFLEERMRSRILATDISPRALVKARAASYGAWSLRGTHDAFRQRYFRKFGDRYVLNDEVRRRVRFDTLNLASDAYPSHAGGTSNLDLILCRNVLIYFDADTIREVGRRLMRSLAPGGWLLLGASDPALECLEGVQRVSLASGFAYHRAGVEKSADVPVQLPRIEYDFGVRQPELPLPLPLPQPTPAALPPEPTAATSAPHSKEDAIERLRRAADTSRSPEVLTLATELIARFPLAAELHLLYALILLDLGNDDAAEPVLRRALFLDRSLAAAHFALGTLLQRRGQGDAAERAFRNAVAAADGPIRVAAELALRGMEERT